MLSILLLSICTHLFQNELLQNDSNTVRTGKLIEIEYDVVGTVTLSTDSNTLKISFSTDFETDEGPDLFVMLATKADEHNETDLLVAKLKEFEGAQSYQIKNIPIQKFDYIQIWCKEYNVVFSSAKLNP